MRTNIILLSVLSIFIGIGELKAATMCVENTSTAIVLDPSITGTGYTYDSINWKTTFPYGFISGTSACLSSNNGKSMGGYVKDLQDNGKDVVGGERNGGYCWCKMTHPAVSAWVFRSSLSASNCASFCTDYCGYDARAYSAMRAGLFGSVAN